MFDTVFVANRGEIAARVIRAAHGIGVRSVAAYSDADRDLPYVDQADTAIRLGPAPVRESYLDADVVLDAALRSGADAVHPGYGFFAEDADFARRVLEAGLVWIGPSPAAMRLMADKIAARNAMAAGGLAVAPGLTDPAETSVQARAGADRIGYPVMLKAAAGGGGLGMAAVHRPAELADAFDRVASVSARLFGSSRVLVERLVSRARHVEVQLIGLADGRVVPVGLRDCSVQRRNQKIVEEAPPSALDPGLASRLMYDAARAVGSIDYRGLGTVECLVDLDRGDYVFIEMNTRLQVEHPITEMTTGIDLVVEQLLVAAGSSPRFEPDDLVTTGHAVEVRVCAEDPVRMLPSAGTITEWQLPAGKGVRVEAGYRAGNTVTPHYDSLLAKVCVWGTDRADALARARIVLAESRIEGIRTNLPLLRAVLDSDEFIAGGYPTDILTRLTPSEPATAGHGAGPTTPEEC